jgi:CheY-like chemotaxis protein
MRSDQHILVVDDEPAFLDSTVELLALEGFRVTGATSGIDALRRLAQRDSERFDVFLIDFRMPGLNGGETLLAMRAAGVSGCAILVSAAADIERIAREFKFDNLVRKPCDLDELIAAIRRCTGPARLPSAQPNP